CHDRHPAGAVCHLDLAVAADAMDGRIQVILAARGAAGKAAVAAGLRARASEIRTRPAAAAAAIVAVVGAIAAVEGSADAIVERPAAARASIRGIAAIA